MDLRESNLASAGVLAAELLVRACGAGDDLHASTVRDLAGDLARVLGSLSETSTPDASVRAALACADLATLAACNAPVLGDGGEPTAAARPAATAAATAAAAAHLAAGTTRALVALVEAGPDGPAGGTDGGPGDARRAYALRDVRGAGWKADLAVRQLGGEG